MSPDIWGGSNRRCWAVSFARPRMPRSTRRCGFPKARRWALVAQFPRGVFSRVRIGIPAALQRMRADDLMVFYGFSDVSAKSRPKSVSWSKNALKSEFYRDNILLISF